MLTVKHFIDAISSGNIGLHDSDDAGSSLHDRSFEQYGACNSQNSKADLHSIQLFPD